jgi:hypothetical protein
MVTPSQWRNWFDVGRGRRSGVALSRRTDGAGIIHRDLKPSIYLHHPARGDAQGVWTSGLAKPLSAESSPPCECRKPPTRVSSRDLGPPPATAELHVTRTSERRGGPMRERMSSRLASCPHTRWRLEKDPCAGPTPAVVFDAHSDMSLPHHQSAQSGALNTPRPNSGSILKALAKDRTLRYRNDRRTARRSSLPLCLPAESEHCTRAGPQTSGSCGFFPSLVLFGWHPPDLVAYTISACPAAAITLAGPRRP